MASKKLANQVKNPLELEERPSDSILRGLSEETKQWSKGFLDQIIGLGEYASHPTSGDLKPGQELHLGKSKAPAKQESSWADFLFNQNEIPVKQALHKKEAAPGLDYQREIVTMESHMHAKEKAELKQAIKEIQMELQKLVASSSMLQVEFSQVSMSQAPKDPGKYHVNFFQWVLTVIRQARMKVEDAGAWQAAIKGKRKNGFWQRAKKEGTTFLLHHDRNVATQAG